METKGYIHVYTGDGKGKTTAALGLALRATDAGKKVFIAQYAKGQHYSELDALDIYPPSITLKQFGLECFILNTPTPEDIDATLSGLNEIETILSDDIYDVIIWDEANIAIFYNLFTSQQLIDILDKRNPRLELYRYWSRNI